MIKNRNSHSFIWLRIWVVSTKEKKSNTVARLGANWGLPFVAAFVIILVVSISEILIGSKILANTLAELAFYVLAAGIVLQLVSYVGYRVSPSDSVSFRTGIWKNWFDKKRSRTALVVFLVALILLTTSTLVYYHPTTPSRPANHHYLPLSASLSFEDTVNGPNDSVQITLGITSSGGVAPYIFIAKWSDGYSQTNEVGVFIRAFLRGQLIPNSLTVVVQSTDNESTSVLVNISPVNSVTVTQSSSSISILATKTRNLNSTLSTTTSIPSLDHLLFLEDGLPRGTDWSVTFFGVTETSTTDEINFESVPGNYSFFISYKYDGNFTTVYVANPESGTIDLENGTSYIVRNITFSAVRLEYPPSELFSIEGQPILNVSNGMVVLTASYNSSLPAQLQTVVLLTVTDNSSGQLVTEQTATIESQGIGVSTARLILVGLRPGYYLISLYLASVNGVRLSKITNESITIVNGN